MIVVMYPSIDQLLAVISALPVRRISPGFIVGPGEIKL
jgi:hypothetical protein